MFPWMAFDAMGVVESEVLGPVPRLCQFKDGAQERRIIRLALQ
jgi:hypothetical protein